MNRAFRAAAVLALASVAAAVLSGPPAQAQTAQSVPHDWPLIPAGVKPGDSFRLLFVTSTSTPAPDAAISTYNSFVQTRAAANTNLAGFSGQFRALISTPTVDARDNTATTGTGVPIYWVGGAKVADNYADLYDGRWDSEAGRTETGADRSRLNHVVWTGSNADGTKHANLPVDGQGLTAVGVLDGNLGIPEGPVHRPGQERDASEYVTDSQTNPPTKARDTYPLYGLSPVITVRQPPPTTPPPPAGHVSYWQATLTVDQWGDHFGCDNQLPLLDNCSSSSVLTDDDFIYRGTTYTVEDLFWLRGSTNALRFDVNIPGDSLTGGPTKIALAGLTLRIRFTNSSGTVTKTFAIDASTVHDVQLLNWSLHGPAWTDGQQIAVSLTGPESTAPEISFDSATPVVGTPYSITITDAGSKVASYAVLEVPGTATDATGCDDPSPSGDDFVIIDVTPRVSRKVVSYTPLEAGKKLCVYADDVNVNRTSALHGTAIAAVPPTVQPGWQYVPSGVGAGQSFRLLFVTSTPTDATSSNIAHYNTFVQTQAATNANLASFSGQFRALISTATVDARDNTATTGAGVPIYWLGGAKAADNYADFYDDSWNETKGKTESGGDPIIRAAWTGSNADGTKHATASAGQTNVRWGFYNNERRRLQTGGSPLSQGEDMSSSAATHVLYALSPVITVQAAAPPPGTTPPDTTPPGIAFSTARPTVGIPYSITLTDSGSKVSAYAVLEVAGTETTADLCDDPRVDGFVIVGVSPVASKVVTYTPKAAGKKLCVYAEDAGGYRTSMLSDAIAAAPPAGDDDDDDGDGDGTDDDGTGDGDGTDDDGTGDGDGGPRPGDDDDDDDDDGTGDEPSSCTLVAPFWSGFAGGFTVKPAPGRTSVSVTCGDRTTEYVAEDGLVTRLVNGRCRGGLQLEGAAPGGWYWQHGERNAAAAPLVCSEALGGPRAVVPGGVEAEATDNGTWLRHDTARLVGIVPHLAGNECSEYVTPYWQGDGGVVFRPAEDQRVTVRVHCGTTWSTMRPSAGDDGVIAALVRKDYCTDDEGEPKQGRLTVTGAAPGGWYWISGERNAAVAPLMCADLLGGPAAVRPGGVSSRTTEDGTYFSHDTDRLIGVVPHVAPDGEGN